MLPRRLQLVAGEAVVKGTIQVADAAGAPVGICEAGQGLLAFPRVKTQRFTQAGITMQKWLDMMRADTFKSMQNAAGGVLEPPCQRARD